MSALPRIRSQYNRPSRESGRSYSPAPSRLSQHAERPSPFGNFPDEEYRKAGSMWTWATLPEETFFCDEGQPDREVNIMRGIEAWKWEDGDIENQTEIRELMEEDVQGWLKEEVPEVDEKRPCAGMRILQINQPFRDEMPLTSRTFEAILNEFTLPPVELHQSSVKQGAIVFLEEDDGSYGIPSFPSWNVGQWPTNIAKFLCIEEPTSKISPALLFDTTRRRTSQQDIS
jgi:hypothetical protein